MLDQVWKIKAYGDKLCRPWGRQAARPHFAAWYSLGVLGLLIEDHVLRGNRARNEDGWSWLPVTTDRDGEVEFEAEPAAAVRGVLRDRDGAALPHLEVRLVPDHPKRAARRFGRMRGRFGPAMPTGHTDRQGALHLFDHRRCLSGRWRDLPAAAGATMRKD